jgi:hypothetical protein
MRLCRFGFPRHAMLRFHRRHLARSGVAAQPEAKTARALATIVFGAEAAED